MKNKKHIYDHEFYADISEGSTRSARAIVPVVLEMVPASSVIDIGCGTGAWLSVFQENGVAEIVGVDGDYVDEDQLKIPISSFIAHDLTRPIDIGRKFDLAMSLEVAEHLPESSAETFVDLLCGLSSAILFSAAAPGQDGVNHINEQWPNYWAKKFAERDFGCFDPFRLRFWQDPNVESWYKQNILMFVQTERIKDYPKLLSAKLRDSDPNSLVHPDFLLHQMSKAQKKLVRAALKIDSGLRVVLGKDE